MGKKIEITYDSKTWNFDIKDMTSKLAADIEDKTTEVFPDGTVSPIGGFGTYKNTKLSMCLAQTHDGQPVTKEYIDELPVAIRNCLLKIITEEEGESASFREIPG